MNEALRADLDADRVWNMIADIRICMLATHDGAAIRARPMEAAPRQPENAVYFLTDVESAKGHQLAEDAHVCLAFAQPSEGRFLSVSGEARLLNDRPLIRALWKRDYAAFWTDAEDSSIRVIEFTPREAELWERPGGLVGAVAMIAARAVGETPDLGDQRKVDLH
ncbi:MAG TPA: pyridoxamine 5'-phosphate oxidase family protein [Caulobacterales bacterium]|nr:pyridoxamine 5'-phosphate oxidase family protein [Caulobacterales bacterium]